MDLYFEHEKPVPKSTVLPNERVVPCGWMKYFLILGGHHSFKNTEFIATFAGGFWFSNGSYSMEQKRYQKINIPSVEQNWKKQGELIKNSKECLWGSAMDKSLIGSDCQAPSVGVMTSGPRM